MAKVDFQIPNSPAEFWVGDSVVGTAEVFLLDEIPIENVKVSFSCEGQVKWLDESKGGVVSEEACAFKNHETYHEEVAALDPNTISKEVARTGFQKFGIPFSFRIPDDKDLPSTMTDVHGWIKYVLRVTVKPNNDYEREEKFEKEVIVLAPPTEENLMVSVGGSAEKSVLLHHGTVLMNASIERKGWAPGESISVLLNIDNKTHANVTPRIHLHQTVTYKTHHGHKTVENNGEPPITGSVVPGKSLGEELIMWAIPVGQSLSVKSKLITVEYNVRVTLAIPNSIDLHLTLPIVLTSMKVIEELQAKKNASN